MTAYTFHQVDVFTDTAFAGNPLAVFIDGRGLSDGQMQDIAREMNLSETTFVLPPEGDGHAKVRIFTPASELPFAGPPQRRHGRTSSSGTASWPARGARHARHAGARRRARQSSTSQVRDGEPAGRHSASGCRRATARTSRAGGRRSCSGLEEADLHPELWPGRRRHRAGLRRHPAARAERAGRITLDAGLLPAFEADFAEVYPCAFTGDDEPWMEARGLFPLIGIAGGPGHGQRGGSARRLRGAGRPAGAGRDARRAAGRLRGPAEPARRVVTGAADRDRRHPGRRSRSGLSCGASSPCRADTIGGSRGGAAGPAAARSSRPRRRRRHPSPNRRPRGSSHEDRGRGRPRRVRHQGGRRAPPSFAGTRGHRRRHRLGRRLRRLSGLRAPSRRHGSVRRGRARPARLRHRPGHLHERQPSPRRARRRLLHAVPGRDGAASQRRQRPVPWRPSAQRGRGVGDHRGLDGHAVRGRSPREPHRPYRRGSWRRSRESGRARVAAGAAVPP